MHCCHPPLPRPPRPAPPQGWLMQRIIACERRVQPCLCAEWRFEGCCGHTIQSVSACGAPPDWHIQNSCLHVALPLHVQLCASCRCCTRTASVNVECDLPPGFLRCMNEARTGLFLLPCVQLLRADSGCDGVFRVQLRITLEICLLRYETCLCAPAQPACPQLPLYPPPMC